MAITPDATLAAGPSGSVNSYTQSITIAPGATALYVASFNNANISTMTATFNGTTMTKTCFSTDGSIYTYLFDIQNPIAGTHDIIVSTNGANANIWIYAASFFGTAGLAAEATSATNGNSGTNTNTLTTVATGALHIATFVNQNGSVQTAGAGTQAVILDAGATHGLYASSPYGVVSAGLHTISVTNTASLWTNAGASYAPASAAASLSTRRALVGVGI